MHWSRLRPILVAAPVAVLLLHCQAEPTEKITLSGGSLAGAWSAISEGLVSCMRREMPDVAITNEPGLDGANAAMVDSGRVQLGIIHAGMARLAVKGEYPYQAPLKNLRGISQVYTDSALHFLVDQRTGLTSIEQIKERRYPLRLSVIYGGSLMEIAGRTVLEAYGISYDDIESWGGEVYFRALRPSLELMKAGRLDAVSLAVQFPQSQISEASREQPLRLLPLSDAAIEYVNERLGSYASRIPAGTYSFLEQDVSTISDVVVLIANAELEDDKAYTIAAAIFKNLGYLHQVHRALARLTPEQLPQVNHVPLHPGAQRFYEDAGLK